MFFTTRCKGFGFVEVRTLGLLQNSYQKEDGPGLQAALVRRSERRWQVFNPGP